METKCQVVHCSSADTDIAPTPAILTVKRHEIVTLDKGACAMIVYRGRFEVINPQERKFAPLERELDSTQPRFIMGVDETNEAIVFQLPVFPVPRSNHDEAMTVKRPVPVSVSSFSNGVATSNVSGEPSKKRKSSNVNSVRAKYAERLVTKLVHEFVGTMLIVPVDGKECTAPITSVSFTIHGTILFCVDNGRGARNITASDWIFDLGFRKGTGRTDFSWWGIAHVQRPGGTKLPLASLIPWELKTFTNEEAVVEYLEKDYLPILNGPRS